MNLEIRITVG